MEFLIFRRSGVYLKKAKSEEQVDDDQDLKSVSSILFYDKLSIEIIEKYATLFSNFTGNLQIYTEQEQSLIDMFKVLNGLTLSNITDISILNKINVKTSICIEKINANINIGNFVNIPNLLIDECKNIKFNGCVINKLTIKKSLNINISKCKINDKLHISYCGNVFLFQNEITYCDVDYVKNTYVKKCKIPQVMNIKHPYANYHIVYLIDSDFDRLRIYNTHDVFCKNITTLYWLSQASNFIQFKDLNQIHTMELTYHKIVTGLQHVNGVKKLNIQDVKYLNNVYKLVFGLTSLTGNVKGLIKYLYNNIRK